MRCVAVMLDTVHAVMHFDATVLFTIQQRTAVFKRSRSSGTGTRSRRPQKNPSRRALGAAPNTHINIQSVAPKRAIGEHEGANCLSLYPLHLLALGSPVPLAFLVLILRGSALPRFTASANPKDSSCWGQEWSEKYGKKCYPNHIDHACQ